MPDNLTIFGTTYNNVTGIKATDTNGVVQTFTNGGSPAPAPAPHVNSGVQFFDYEGTLLYSYSTAEALALSALPANPSHTGLTAQGWNWSLANIQSYLTKYPNAVVNVGQMYVTDDGKTRIYIHLDEERKSPMLGVMVKGTVDVDWGDESQHDTLTSSMFTTLQWTPTHNYATGGDYVIKLTTTSEMRFYGESADNKHSCILRHSSGADVRNNHYNNAIKKVEIGSKFQALGDYAFYGCCSLSSVSIPNSVTLIRTGAFLECSSLASMTLPDGMTSNTENDIFRSSSLSSVSLPKAFEFGNSIFGGCKSLSELTVPDGLTSVGNSAMSSLYTITKLFIPDSVTSIKTQAFYNCYGMAEYHLLPTTPPTLVDTSAFTGIPADCIIYVPYSADHSILNAYQTATNWSTYADYMQEEPA